MKIIIYGTGGVGGYFGARLAESGNDVTFIARGKHLDAIQKNGLQLKSIKGDYTVFPAKATNDITTISNPDLILIGTKTWQAAAAAKEILPVISKDTIVISLLNGVTNIDAVLTSIPKENLLGGLCRIISKIEGYGIINHVGAEPFITFGELNNQKTERVEKLHAILNKAGIANQIPEDIQHAIWSKFLFITTVSAIGGLTRATLGVMRVLPETREMMHQTATEIIQVANAKGINLTSVDLEKTFQTIDNLPFETTASLQRDIMDGRPSELASQVGTIHQLGKELNIKTPTNSFIYHSLLPQENSARQKS